MIFTCRQCRVLLPGYIRRELTPKQRERVSRHLNDCVECYVMYTDERNLMRELGSTLPRMGGTPPLESMRTAIMAQMKQPVKNAAPRFRLDHARYSLAALLLMIALLLPLSMRDPSYDVPTPPTPEVAASQGTAVAAALPAEAATLTATLQANYAPVLGATDTP